MWQRVIEIIGVENARRLRHEFGGERVYIPEREKKELLVPVVKEMAKDKDMNYQKISKRLNISICTVKRYMKCT